MKKIILQFLSFRTKNEEESQYKISQSPRKRGSFRNDKLIKLFFFFTILFSISSFSQETTYKEYSYTQLFKMIEAEKDSIFKLSDAKIVFDAKTDSIFLDKSSLLLSSKPVRTDSIHINKQLEFTNIDFVLSANASLSLIQFHKRVDFRNSTNLILKECTFHQGLRIMNRKDKLIEFNLIVIHKSSIWGDLSLYFESEKDNITLMLYDNYIRNDRSFITQSGKGNLIIRNNEFNSRYGNISNYTQEITSGTVNYELMNNKFDISEAISLTIKTTNLEYLKVANNSSLSIALPKADKRNREVSSVKINLSFRT